MRWGRVEGKRVEIHVYTQLIHVVVQQKLTQNRNYTPIKKKKYTVSVCHKPGKVLSTGVVLIAVNILKTKISTHRG